ncbi:MAG: DMT family transporter [Corynebacterium sp.]|nr:DMT family transporter [Corynebacterium sp.]
MASHTPFAPTAVFATSLIIFGTIGVVRRMIDLPSAFIAASRGVFGAVTIALIVVALRRSVRRGFDWQFVRANWKLLAFSGIMLGLNWAWLFEAYQFTTIATAQLMLYMGPIFVIVLSPLLLHERLRGFKVICVGVAFVGLLLVSVFNTAVPATENPDHVVGVAYGLLAACGYTSVVIATKKLSPTSSDGSIDPYTNTVAQLVFCSIVLIPYSLLVDDWFAPGVLTFTPQTVVFLALICVVFTGINYILFFGPVPHMSAQSIAVLSYLDPAVALTVSAVLLHEPLGGAGIIGAVLIIGAAIVSEITPARKL